MKYKEKCPSSLPCLRGGYSNPKNCQKCLCPDGFSGTFCDEVAPSFGIEFTKFFSWFALLILTFSYNKSIGLCGGLMKNFTGVIQTPNHPLYYPGFISCNWLIQVNLKNLLILQ